MLALLPSTSELLWLTIAFAPMAVAFVMLAAPFAWKPTKVLLFSVVLDNPAPRPTNVLPVPVVLDTPAKFPKKEL